MAPKLTFNSVYRNATNNLKSKSTPPFLFFRRLRSFGRQAGGVWGGGGRLIKFVSLPSTPCCQSTEAETNQYFTTLVVVAWRAEVQLTYYTAMRTSLSGQKYFRMYEYIRME